MIKLFTVKDGVVSPTEHCYTLSVLKDIMEEYQENEEYLKVYAFLFYMTCPSDEDNPFFNVRELDREEIIMEQLNPDFSTEDELIENGLKFCTELYSTPTKRAYDGIAAMLDRIADYMKVTTITDGRDGNITAIVNASAKFEAIRSSFKGAYKDLKDEQGSSVRGGQKLAYDQ